MLFLSNETRDRGIEIGSKVLHEAAIVKVAAGFTNVDDQFQFRQALSLTDSLCLSLKHTF